MIWTAVRADLIRYLSRAAALHTKGGPGAAGPTGPGPGGGHPLCGQLSIKTGRQPLRGWEDFNVAPAYNLFNCASKGIKGGEG